MGDEPQSGRNERSTRWASTMDGYAGPVRLAHADSRARIDPITDTLAPPASPPRHAWGREEREELERSLLAPGATRAVGCR